MYSHSGKKDPTKEEEKENRPEEKENNSSSMITSKLRKLPPQSSAVETPQSTDSLQVSNEIKIIIDKLNANDPELKELDLSKQKMTTEEKKQIFTALATSNIVTLANFDGIRFSYTDATNFSQAFSTHSNSTLKTLMLNNNQIDANTLEVILKTSNKLDKLVLINNDVGDDGAKLVATLATMPNVGLHQNRITLQGVNHMLNSKKNFSAITYISLKLGNPIGIYKPLEDKIAALSSVNNANTTSIPPPK